MNKQKTTLLITGFGPFPGTPDNPSELLVKALAQDRLMAARLNVKIICAVVPTSWQKLGLALGKLFRQHHPDYAMHIGYTSDSPGFRLESSAFNQTCGEDDVDGVPGSCKAIIKDHPAKLASALPLEKLQDQLNRSGHTAILSHDPGRYLCNKAYYLSLDRSPASLFIHIPAIKTENGLIPHNHLEEHHLSLNDTLEGLELIISLLLNEQTA